MPDAEGVTPARTPCDHERLWQAVYAHRERLLRLSRARTPTEQDAEDVVQEAMLRCVEFSGLDEARLGPFLTTVTVRLCTDRYREHSQDARLLQRLVGRETTMPGPEDDVCERGEAEWLARLVDDLPERQREILRARQAGLSHAEVARRLRISYTAVESSIARARVRFREALTRGMGAIAPTAWRWSPSVEAAAMTVVVVGGLVAGGSAGSAQVPDVTSRVVAHRPVVRPAAKPVRPRPALQTAPPRMHANPVPTTAHDPIREGIRSEGMGLLARRESVDRPLGVCVMAVAAKDKARCRLDGEEVL